jgi:hypothetical protein
MTQDEVRETPRTDAVALGRNEGCKFPDDPDGEPYFAWTDYSVLADFARSLEQQLADCKDDMLRLHKEKMDLWESIHFPGGFKDQIAAAQRMREALRDSAEAWQDLSNSEGEIDTTWLRGFAKQCEEQAKTAAAEWDALKGG